MKPRPAFAWPGFVFEGHPMAKKPRKKALRPATQLVHGGILRSQFGENSEALFLTQGYVYDTAEQAEARFKGTDPGFIYSRYNNPTVAMFEERMRLLEGAEAARGTASGMAAVTAVFLSWLTQGDHVVAAKALFGSCRYVIEDLLPRYGITSTLVDGNDLGAWKKAARKNTKAFFLESPTNPTLEVYDIAGDRRDRPQGRRATYRRQRLRHAARCSSRSSSAPTSSSIRRPSTSTAAGRVPRRRHPRRREVHRRSCPHVPAPDRPVAQPVQRLGVAQGPGDAGGARRAAERRTRRSSPTPSPTIPKSRACSIRAVRTTRNTNSPSGR